MEEELTSQENNPENSISSVEEDRNSIGEGGPVIGSDVPTHPDKVYRSVNGLGAIEDIYDSGVVRSSVSAKENKEIEGNTNSKGKKVIYWTKGAEGKSHMVPKDTYLIEAPYDIAKERLVKKEDITAIYSKLEDNSVNNLLENPDKLETDIIEYRLEILSTEIEKKKITIDTTTNQVNTVRHELGLSGEEKDIPSISGDKKEIINLENEKKELEEKLKEILKSDVSEKYVDIIKEVKQSKIDWAHSEDFARRLRLKGVTEEDISEVKKWLVDNTQNAKTFILPQDKFKEAIEVLSEMTKEDSLKDAKGGFYVEGGRKDVPEDIKNGIFIKEDALSRDPNVNTLHHEMGHASQDGLLKSEPYQEWNPKFKAGAPDIEYVGDIKETDTRIRTMFRELEHVFDPQKEPFTHEHIDLLRKRSTKNQDIRDLFEHYDDETIIKMANELPAI